MADGTRPPAGSSSIPPPFDWSTRRESKWFSASGAQRLREKVEPLLDFTLDTFQVECSARLLDGQDVMCIASTGAGKTALIYVPLLAREGTISIVVAPTNFLQRDMVSAAKFRGFCAVNASQVASMEKKNISSIAINSVTLTAASLASPRRDLWAEARTGAHRLIFIGPEMMKSADYQAFIADKNVRARLSQFTVDELHVADEWGVDFRKDYQDIPTMRARLPEHTTFLGLSASVEPGRQYEACVKLMGFQRGFHLEKRDCERRNVAFVVRSIKYASSGHEFRDLDFLVRPDLVKASDEPKHLVFIQEIEPGHRLVKYFRSILPAHLRKDAHRLIRHHHSMACELCKEEGMEALYKIGDDRDCLIHVSTDVLTVGVDIPSLKAVVIYNKMSSASGMTQRAGRPARERGSTGFAYIYVSKADMVDALAYVNSEVGKLDKRVLTAKDPTSHVRIDTTAPVEGTVDAEASANNATPVESENVVTATATSTAKKPKASTGKKGTPGFVAKPGQRTCISLLLVFAAHARNLCITRQINMIYGNPGVDKDCGRCSSCVGDVVPGPRELLPATQPAAPVVDTETEKIPGWMKPQAKDLKGVAEKLEKIVRSISWSRPRRPDALLVGAKVLFPPTISSAITTDFLLITSHDVFKARVQQWKYAPEYGEALWHDVELLANELRETLKRRHDEALEKQRAARLHKQIVTAGLAGITRVRLKLPTNPAEVGEDSQARG
ncbi:P-loop containing nucleoside triphosphate hydrolase protein [Mycena metata]|uniref:DNA 3'-5' helicase n=1 Tax=Mycena metata TaxID=1033252 RepID=A0AAD7MG10_9AGAR|nr:P-loop containing nucleoside triphosphate hydrolase protein [Mycena metata]